MKPHKCPVCDGSGRRMTTAVWAHGRVVMMPKDLGACPACNGACVLWEPKHKPNPICGSPLDIPIVVDKTKPQFDIAPCDNPEEDGPVLVMRCKQCGVEASQHGHSCRTD